MNPTCVSHHGDCEFVVTAIPTDGRSHYWMGVEDDESAIACRGSARTDSYGRAGDPAVASNGDSDDDDESDTTYPWSFSETGD